VVPFSCGRYVHGLKVVCPPHPSDQNKWACVLEVFDFNVHPKKLPEADNTTRTTDRAQASGSGPRKDTQADTHPETPRSFSSSSFPGSPPTLHSSPSSSLAVTREVSYTVHTEPSRVPASCVFVNDVVSKLPYTHAMRKDLSAVYSGFMIDDERIVGLKVGIVFFLLACASLGERSSYL